MEAIDSYEGIPLSHSPHPRSSQIHNRSGEDSQTPSIPHLVSEMDVSLPLCFPALPSTEYVALLLNTWHRWKFTDQVNADDAALFTSDAANWPTVLTMFDSAAATMGLHTSGAKTRVQNLGSGSPASPVDVANERIESVKRFTRLGSDLDSSGYCSPEILRRIGIASSVIGKLDNVWKQSRRSLRKKLRIHTSCVQSNPQG